MFKFHVHVHDDVKMGILDSRGEERESFMGYCGEILTGFLYIGTP